MYIYIYIYIRYIRYIYDINIVYLYPIELIYSEKRGGYNRINFSVQYESYGVGGIVKYN